MNYLSLLWNLYQLKRNAVMNRRQLKELQEKKLRKLLEYAYDNSKYYNRVFEEAGITRKRISMMPLSAFPVLDKQLLMEHFDELVTDSDLKQEELRRFDEEESTDQKTFKDQYHVVHSSGSTGTPGYFVYDEEAWTQMLLGIIRAALWDMGMPQILKLLWKGPRIVYIAATDGRYGGAMAVGDGIRGVHADQLFLDVKTPLPEWIRQIQEFKPNMLIGYPSAIKILGELVENGSMYLTSLYNYVQPLIRYRISDQLNLREPAAGSPYPFTLAGNIMGRNEDLMWFEDSYGSRDFLHPLVIEGFCLDGLLDYQFCKLDKDSFEMLAEVSDARKVHEIRSEMLKQMGQILREKHLEYVNFSIRFVEEIRPDVKTGKKRLIVA